MNTSIGKRLSWIELVLDQQDDRKAVVVDFSVFSDADIDRLTWFAEHRATWSGDDWIESGLSPVERQELHELWEKTSSDSA